MSAAFILQINSLHSSIGLYFAYATFFFFHNVGMVSFFATQY